MQIIYPQDKRKSVVRILITTANTVVALVLCTEAVLRFASFLSTWKPLRLKKRSIGFGKRK